MDRDEATLSNRFGRSLRSPSQGRAIASTSMGANASTSTITPGTSSTKVDSDGKVRRLWIEGDPWTDDYYFGGG